MRVPRPAVSLGTARAIVQNEGREAIRRPSRQVTGGPRGIALIGHRDDREDITVSASGEIDMETADHLKQTLTGLCVDGETMRLDLRERDLH